MLIFSILKLMRPLGACISATSPSFLPMSPFPIGEVMDIFDAFRSASFSETIWYVTVLLVARFVMVTLVRIDS